MTGTAYAAVLPSLTQPLGTSLEKSYACPVLLLLLLVLDEVEVDEEDATGMAGDEEEIGVYVAIFVRVIMLEIADEDDRVAEPIEPVRDVSMSTPRIAFVDLAHPRVVDASALSSGISPSFAAVGDALFCLVLGPSVPASEESSLLLCPSLSPLPALPPAPESDEACLLPSRPFKDQSLDGTHSPSMYS